MNPQDPYQNPPQSTPPAAQPPTPASQPYTPPAPEQPYAPQPSTYAPQPAPSQPGELPPLSSPAPAPSVQSQYPVDYLNKIAAPAQQRTLNKFAVFGLIAAFLAIVFFALFMMLGGGTPNVKAQATTMRDRVRTLATVTKEQQGRLTESDLTSMNATLNTSLTSMNSELTTLVGEKQSSNGSTTAKPKEKKEQAYLDKLSTKLNDAYLRGTLDRTYSTDMAYQLAILKSQFQKLASTSKSSAAKEFVAKNVPTLDAAIKEFSEFSATK